MFVSDSPDDALSSLGSSVRGLFSANESRFFSYPERSR